ncbi:MAG: hypothetical protein H6577_21500 [Lewinellaceae bacterium]|nr:hypothetical protein [Lewinellaceae bacterium]
MNILVKYAHWPAAMLMVALTIGLGYFTEQNEFPKIIGFYAPWFLLYLFVLPRSPFTIRQSPVNIQFWLAIALLLRLILVFSMPNLSNDVYRFIWDGRLLVQGYNPFDHQPVYYLENAIPIKGIDRALFDAFGAKNTYTVYPPVAQAQFGSACWLFPESIYWGSVVMKCWLFAFEAGTLCLLVKLLKRHNLPTGNVLLYALNPLIITEIMGNLHFEGAMVFFLLLAFWLLPNYRKATFNNLILSAGAFALSICSKLLTLLFLPFLVKWLGWRRSLLYFLLTGLFTVLLFVPIVNSTFLLNFGDSLNLYFQKLEYNASLYYVLRWVGFQIWGYNNIALIGPLLGLVAMGVILWMAFGKWKRDSRLQQIEWPEKWLFAICVYLLCTTTLHPWYLALPIALCVFTKWRFPIVWSGMIFLTYINYSYDPYHENLWLVALEYLTVLAWFLYEWKSGREKALPF